MTNTKTLTQGPVSRQLMALALPLLGGNILQQLYNTVDAVIVGRVVGDAAFAGVGVAGAAWATVASQALAALLCLGYLRKSFPSLTFRRGDMTFDGPLLRRTARFSLVAALQSCNLYIGKLLVQRTVNGLGTAAISAYTAATRIEGFANSFGDSGCASMSVFIGQNTGAGETDRVREGFTAGERLLAGLGIFMSLVMIFGACPLLKLVLPEGNGESLAPALGYLRLVACFYLFNFLGSGLSGYFQGRGKMHLPVLGSTGHITFRVLFSWLLAPRLGLPAVAVCTGLGWVGVVAFWTFLRKREWAALTSPSPEAP